MQCFIFAYIYLINPHLKSHFCCVQGESDQVSKTCCCTSSKKLDSGSWWQVGRFYSNHFSVLLTGETAVREFNFLLYSFLCFLTWGRIISISGSDSSSQMNLDSDSRINKHLGCNLPQRTADSRSSFFQKDNSLVFYFKCFNTFGHKKLWLNVPKQHSSSTTLQRNI